MATHKILVIDDSRVIRNTVRDMLPPGNFEVLEAKDGIEGLNMIRQEKPNMIMLDFLLPRMSGWEVYQQIQAQSDLQTIPLVVMSGRKGEVTEKIAEPFQNFAFIEKPFEQSDLVNAIKIAMQIAKEKQKVTTAIKVAEPAVASDSGETMAKLQAEVQDLRQKVAQIKPLEEKLGKAISEIDGLKKQLAQLVTFIKQKLK